MEEVGVHVVYGLSGLKTHCKCCLIVRREEINFVVMPIWVRGTTTQVRRKVIPITVFFTSNPAFTSDLANLFNTLTGYTRKPSFKKILVAPFNLHAEMIRLIKEETSAAKRGKDARVVIKVNSLIDPDAIQCLYEASQAG